MKAKSAYDPHYRTHLLFMEGGTPKEARDYIRGKYKEMVEGHPGEDVPGFATAVTMDNDVDKIFILWVADIKDTPVLLHEVIHMAANVYKHRGIVMNAYNDEELAYYVQWIAEECIKALGSRKA